MEEYLESLRGVARSDDPAGALEVVEAKILQVRAAQTTQQQRLATEPTLFPFVNRLLLHYQTVREGAHPRRLAQILEEAPNFLRWLRLELADRLVPPKQTRAVFHLEQLLEAIEGLLENGEELPPIESEVVELASGLTGWLAEPSPEAHQGPTPIPAVNKLFQAVEACVGEPEEIDFLCAIVGQARLANQP